MMIRLETALAIGGSIALTLVIGFFGIRSEQKQIPISTTAVVEAAQSTTKPCDQPAETYLLNAQRVIAKTTSVERSSVDIATTASAWMHLYQICSGLQKESAH